MIQLLGPSGVRQRMAELQNRLDSLIPSPQQEFHGLIEQNMLGSMAGFPGLNDLSPESGLTGSINPKGGLAPLNPFGGLASVTPTSELHSLIVQAASENNIDPNLFDALVQTESSYDPKARSRAGALGLTQLMPGTAISLGVQNPYDPKENLNGGARYLSQLITRFGNVRDALAAYNAGPARVLRGGALPLETVRYVDKVVKLAEVKKQQG